LATSPSLPPLSQAPNLNLVGFVAAYFLPQEDLAQEPLVTPAGITADLVLAPGAGWRALPYTPNTLKLDEQPKADRGGPLYQVRVTAQRPQPNAQVLAALAALDRRKLLLLLVEAGGGRRLLGSTEEYVALLTSTEGQHPGTRAGVELRLEGTATRRAPYYSGTVVVLDGASLVPAPAAGAPAGYVTIVNKKGQLMARVAAGTTVTVASGFRVVLSF
jgi:hypothetical protein